MDVGNPLFAASSGPRALSAPVVARLCLAYRFLSNRTGTWESLREFDPRMSTRATECNSVEVSVYWIIVEVSIIG
jgi:hypothetical protein